MFKIISAVTLSLGLILLSPAGPLPAQLAPRAQVSAADAYNPRPDSNDLILPMPCGLQMVFKAVSLPVQGHLVDLETRLGTDDDHPNGFFDRRYKAFLGSALSLDNLPPLFQETARKSLGAYTDQIYLIGKYEVTEAQWEAVMEGCLPLTQESALPKTNISWYDTVAFTEKYMRFLLENHPDELPSFPGDIKNVGLIRLPSEAEWEFAARGGQAVSSDSTSAGIFPLDSGTTLADYGLFQDGVSPPAQKPGRIGAYRPNPLGIYDTVGNAAEMTSDMFKMTLGGRLHGAAGGVVRKGGSFRSDPSEILPGRRQEAALFYRNGPTSSNDLGFRLSLSAVAAPGGSRFSQLAQEWEKIGQAPQLEASANPLEKINRLIQSAESDEERAIFESLRNDMRDFNIMVQRSQEASVRTHCRSLVYAAYSIRNTSMRKNVAEGNAMYANADIDEIRRALKTAPNNEKKALNDLLKDRRDRLARTKKEIEDFDLAISNQFNYYKTLIETASDFDRKLLAGGMAFVQNDIKGNDVHSLEMGKCFNSVVKHIRLMLDGSARRIKVEDLLVTIPKRG